jgi:hypothetical protein
LKKNQGSRKYIMMFFFIFLILLLVYFVVNYFSTGMRNASDELLIDSAAYFSEMIPK